MRRCLPPGCPRLSTRAVESWQPSGPLSLPSWPPTKAAYDYILTLNDEEIAWEGLRRNPDYQRHFRLQRVGHGKPRRLPSGQCVWRVPKPSSGIDRWGLHSFRRSGPDCAGRSHLLARPMPALPCSMLSRSGPPPGAPADLVLADLPCIRHVVIGPGNVEHLLIRTSERSLTIRLTGHRASQAPVCLTYLVPARSSVKETAAILASLPDLMTMRPRWLKRTRDQELIRDAFIALDGRSVGASHREIAEVSFGIKRVREEWSGKGGWLKERMRRALAKGQALCDGGYWKLVERACRFKS